jgi:outer membrane protein OmpA-like peptidoglycan-associated protein
VPEPEPAKPVTPPAARVFELSAIEGSPSTGYAGDSFNFSYRLTDSANAPNIQYSCTIDGNPIPGITGPRFNLTPSAGSHTIICTAKDPATGTTASTAPYTFGVKEVPPLTMTDGEAKPEIKVGETDALTAECSASEYSGAITYTWRTNIGAITGTGTNVTFDSTSVQFDPANVFKPESRTATVTPSCTDQHGRTATGSPLQIRIIKDPQAMRLDDVIYSKNGTRVNNCAKRILLDELQAIMNNNPDVEVLLIGHRDASESSKVLLDHQRVLNAAAVLTAGTGVCGKGDLSRVMVSYAGTDQTSDYRSGFCGTSTRAKSDERKSDEIAADDATAKNRRVEIWIVPKGVAMPAGAKNPQPAPVKVVKAKGCPH